LIVLPLLSIAKTDVIRLAYLVAAIMFILGLRFLSGPRPARRGNVVAAVGMAIAIVATLADDRVLSYGLIAAGMAIGTVIGAVSAQRVRMTAMPQMVALFNGVGGGAAALIAASEYHIRAGEGASALSAKGAVSIMFSAAVGSISFAGSLIAFGKLQELLPGRPITWPAQKAINAAAVAAVIVLAIWSALDVREAPFFIMMAIALGIGVAAVLPIGGADMPVVISLLNSFTGLSAAATGFVLSNDALIIAGTLVGASGTLLTQLMSKAMNRSLANVLFGAFGGGPAVATKAGGLVEDRPVREATATDVAVLLAYARRVVFVPGYGLAVAQAQHGVKELGKLLEARRIDVKYAIHPVAGRMPGHMNVLLAEADVPYDQLWEMEQINPEFTQTDVVVIIGANDVVNPAARDDPESPLYGMPILEVDRAEHVVVLKRSMAAGFAGVDNALFYNPKTMMLFGDAKASITKLVQEVQAV
jgi:proton-translocating NAD(P)+ transhydrogenase subunit beta